MALPGPAKGLAVATVTYINVPLAGVLHESLGHERLKRYHKSVLWPRTAVRRRHAARVGAVGIVHVNYVLKSMRYHSHSRANGRAVGPESHRRPSGAAAESTSRLAVRPTAHGVTWRCTGMVATAWWTPRWPTWPRSRRPTTKESRKTDLLSDRGARAPDHGAPIVVH